MSFHLRHIFNIEVAAITVIILSIALIAYVVLSLTLGCRSKFPGAAGAGIDSPYGDANHL
jgi:hypothetical protein